MQRPNEFVFPTRRRLLQTLGVATGSGVLPAAIGAGESEGVDAEQSDESFSLVQGDRCVPVAPLSGDQSAAAFYDYETGRGSQGTVSLQREDTSLLFLYRDPDGVVSLFVVHGKMGGSSDGGAASFRITGLPSSGEWVVRDDDYGGASQKDNWSVGDSVSTIDWTWVGTLTDGGVFSGLNDGFPVTIEPRFNSDAALYGEYEGTVVTWQLLSGDVDDPDRYPLDLDRPVTLRRDGCQSDGEPSSGTGDDESQRPQGDGEKAKQKHRKKEEKRRQKHRKKQRKHEKKRQKHRKKKQREQRKHRKKQRKHEKKEDREQRKHQKKQRKHQKKQRKHQKKRQKHQKKERHDEREEDDD